MITVWSLWKPASSWFVYRVGQNWLPIDDPSHLLRCFHTCWETYSLTGSEFWPTLHFPRRPFPFHHILPKLVWNIKFSKCSRKSGFNPNQGPGCYPGPCWGLRLDPSHTLQIEIVSSKFAFEVHATSTPRIPMVVDSEHRGFLVFIWSVICAAQHNESVN